MWNCWLAFVSVDIGVTEYGGEGAFGARPLSAGCGTGFRVTILIELIEVIEVGNVLEAHGKGVDFLWIPQARIKRLPRRLWEYLRLWRREVRQQAQPGYEVISSPV